MRLFSTTSSILTSLFLIAMTGTFGACSAPDVCDDSIDVGSLSINPQGSPCTYKCECNNQLYEGFCKDDGSCQSLPREGCRVPGKKRACIPLKLDDSGCKDGIQICQPPELGGRSLWGDCKPLVPTKESGKELCQDGLDNDCDGKTDLGDPECKDICNPGKVEPCFGNEDKTLQGIGICKQGLRYCREDATWGACEGQQLPQQEVCDGQDNDCNGKVDELDECKCWPPLKKETCYSGDSATKGKGECQAGERTCQSNGSWGACIGENPPQPELCNGKDDDCNGQVDDDSKCQCWPPLKKETCYSGDSATKGEGVCQAGERTCGGDGIWGACVGEVTPQKEDCNGKDDDCNGKIDDDSKCQCWPPLTKETCYGGPKETQSKGQCRVGQRTCLSDGTWGSCEGEIIPQQEVCDGQDNDCNGKVDELTECECWPPARTESCYTGPTSTQNIGICAPGTRACQANGKWGICLGQQTPQAEECNLKDDDCDGQIDNKAGSSLNSLTRSCYSGQSGCTLKNGTYTCQGDCKAGTQQCTNGNWGTCINEHIAQAEECNGKDDDCDGVIDEDADLINAPLCLKQRGDCKGAKTPTRLCQNGRWLPCDGNAYKAHFSAYNTKDESCDQKDNDCNGQVDEYAVNCIAAYAGALAGAVDGKGIDAQLRGVRGIRLDGWGNLYVADGENQMIRKVDRCGNVQTIAGTGVAGQQDGYATKMRFLSPHDVSLDNNGALYVADLAADGTTTLRTLDTRGLGTTIIPNTAAFRLLSAATGTYLLSRYKGSPNVASFQSFFGGLLTRLAELPLPSQHLVTGLASTTNGVRYVSADNHQIYQITSSNVVNLFAGTGVVGAKDGAKSQATFSTPNGMATDTQGNLYVADSGNHRIRMIDRSGNVTTLTGAAKGTQTGTLAQARFDTPHSVQVDTDGNIYVSTGDVIRKILRKKPTIMPRECIVTWVGSQFKDAPKGNTDGSQYEASLVRPGGMAIDTLGQIYIADTGSHRIRKLDRAGRVTTLAGQRLGYRDAMGTAAQFYAPEGLTIGPGGDLYVADTANHFIRRVTPSGQVTTYAGGGTAAPSTTPSTQNAMLKSPKELLFLPDGTLLFSDMGHHMLRRVLQSGKIEVYAGGGPTNKTTGARTQIHLASPTWMARHQDGSLAVVSAKHSIYLIAPSGQVTLLAGGTQAGSTDGVGAAARFSSIAGVAWRGDILWVSDAGNHSLRQVDKQGNVTTVAGGTKGYVDGYVVPRMGSPVRFSAPGTLRFDQHGQLFIIDTDNARLRKWVMH